MKVLVSREGNDIRSCWVKCIWCVTYNIKPSFMVAVFPGLSLKDRTGCEVFVNVANTQVPFDIKDLVAGLVGHLDHYEM